MNDGRTQSGNVVIGVMLVLIGVWLLLTRAGFIVWPAGFTLWPPILVGIGLARFIQSPPGGPKEGLLFLTGGVWLFGGEAGWWTLVDSWPVMVIGFGLIIAFNSGRRPRWRDFDRDGTPDGGADADWRRRRRRQPGMLTPMGVIGIWIAIAVAVQVSGLHSFRQSGDAGDRLRVVSVMGSSNHTSHASPFQDANVTNVMGRAELDLRDATIAPGAEATVEVFSVMGRVVLRVPPNWNVDTSTLTTIGEVRDARQSPSTTGPAAAGGAAPRLVLRGLVAMGRLEIRS